jgi:hypothetical protein
MQTLRLDPHPEQDTTINLELRGWPRHHACALCNGPLKTSHHLCLAYPFAQAVWSLVTPWKHFATLDVAQHAHFDTLADW